MDSSKKAKAKLKSVTLNLPGMSLVWESDERDLKDLESELKVLRDLLVQILSRRALDISYEMRSEQPVFFLESITEMRKETRKLLSKLPIGAKESQILILTVMDWLANILDEWSHNMSIICPNAYDFRRLDMSDMHAVMKRSWGTIKKVRKDLHLLGTQLDRMLMDVDCDIKKCTHKLKRPKRTRST